MRYLAISLVLALEVASTPVHKAQSPFGSLPPLSQDVNSNAAMEALLDKYAPVIKLSSVEAFFPSSIEYMLPHYTFIETMDGAVHPINASLLTPSLLDSFPDQGHDQFMSIPEDHNPQPFVTDAKSRYLSGPAGQEGGMATGEDGRGIVNEDVYGFWVDRGKDIVDLWYWTFYPFNYGKPVGPFGVLGNHVGDWEYLRLRTINGSAVSVDYHSHNGGAFSSGTTRWSDTPKIDGRPVAFSAAGSHGLWPTPGDHVFANVLNAFRLVDMTDDDGAVWDTKGHVVSAQYWESSRIRRKVQHVGDRSWLNFRGMWGNRGVDSCWWHKLVPECQLVDAPPGPNRWFGTAPDCIPSPIAWKMSTYSFVLSPFTVRWAEGKDVTSIQVEQICARPRRKTDDSDDDDDEGLAGRAIDYVHDDTDEEDLETWSITESTPFRHYDKHEMTLLPCHGVTSAVKSYRIALCQDGGKCISTSHQRKICTYQEGKKGYRFGHAATVDDIDEWLWRLEA